MLVFLLFMISCVRTHTSWITRPPFIRDCKKTIDISDQSQKAKYVLGKIRGFFGAIGPDTERRNADSLFNLFLGNGIINGMFFDNGNITFVRHLICTEKLEYERKHGKTFSKSPLHLIRDMGLHKAGILPNPMGVANTAFLKTPDGTYATFERDVPYLISVDFYNHSISTVGKAAVKHVPFLSGHCRFDNSVIKSIDYNIFDNLVYYREFDPPFSLKSSKTFESRYMPIIHDFISTDRGSVLFADSPFFFSKSAFPVVFDAKKPVFFHVLKNGIKTLLDTNQSFYIFHYGHFSENRTHLEFYAPIYENLDFSKINLYGKYRRFILDVRRGITTIERNDELDQYNLDFPLKWRNYTILRNLDMAKKRINGFVVCNGLELRDVFFFENRSFCGEPAVINGVDGDDYLVGFAYCNDASGYFCILIRILENGRLDRDYIEIPIGEDIGIGFHSTFIFGF